VQELLEKAVKADQEAGAQKPRGSGRAAPSTVPATPSSTSDATGLAKPKLTAAEAKEFERLLRTGEASGLIPRGRAWADSTTPLSHVPRNSRYKESRRRAAVCALKSDGSFHGLGGESATMGYRRLDAPK
jgi:hypothetical protein